MSTPSDKHLEKEEIKIIDFLRSFDEAVAIQDIANHIKKSRDETVELANSLSEKGIVYFDVNLKYLRVNGDTMGVRIIDNRRDV